MLTPVAIPRARGAFGLVVDGQFGAVFWGKLATAVGVWMHALVAVVVVYDLSGSATAVSLVSLGQFAPQLVLAPLAGKWADSGDKASLIILGQGICVVGTGSLALLLLGQPAPGPTIAWIFVLTLMTGVGLAIAGPPMQAIVPDLIRPGELSVAMALSTFPNNFGRLAGPAVGAVAVARLDPSIAFCLCAGLYAVMVPLMLLASFPAKPSETGDAATLSVRAGLRYAARHRGLRLMLLATLTVTLASEPSITLAPALSEHLTGDDTLVGWLSSGFGLGALVGSGAAMLAPRRVTVRVRATTGLVLLAGGVGAVGLVRAEAWAIGCFVLAGFGFALAMAGFCTLIQAHAAPAYRGRVMALWLIAFVGARPVAALLAGLLTDVAGIPVAFASAGFVVLAAVWVTRPSALGPRAPVA